MMMMQQSPTSTSSSSMLFFSTSYQHSPARFNYPASSFLPTASVPKHSSCSYSTFLRPATPFYYLKSSRLRSRGGSSISRAVTEEAVETVSTDDGFVEVGYICSVHGLRGEVCVKHNTDFPELRFSTPGKRWLKQRISASEKITEVELVGGRGRPGRKSWLVQFKGIDDIDEAKKLVGSTILVRDDDRPEMEEGEFYTRDLIGMRVILKETSEPVGTVVKIFNFGASDLLYVLLDSSTETREEQDGPSEAGHHVWIPFVEPIVPDVDMDRREMLITPPEGLLELNMRSDKRTKKERRLLEWREKKKFQRRLIAAKKKLREMEQQHVFDGFRYGEKSQRKLLADQIVSVNSNLLQQALLDFEMSSERPNVSELDLMPTLKSKSTLKVSEEQLINASRGSQDVYSAMRGVGLSLVSEGKVATVLVLKNGKEQESQAEQLDASPTDDENPNLSCLKTLLADGWGSVEIEQRSSVPVITISPAPEVQAVEELFLRNDYFGFDPQKVSFLEEAELPVVSSSSETDKKHKILMKSPWEILQSPVGSGGIITAFASSNILEVLIERGVEYIQICSITQRSFAGLPIFLGFLKSQGADVGIQTFENTQHFEGSFHIIVSTKAMKALIAAHAKETKFEAILKANPYVELDGKEFVDIVGDSANSYEFRASIYSLLSSLRSINSFCLLEVVT